MPLPQPKVALNDICSVIFNNTLYTYSTNAFQALPLSPGSEWEQLEQGEKVTGGVCVGSTPGDPSTAAFFVIGGRGGRADYHGVQKYTYLTRKWESITLPQPVTQDRLWHGATYLNSSDSILVYAGSQDGSKDPSSQTFTIGASAPFTVLAYESIAPPTINPILLPWSASEAVLIGGSSSNTKVMLFNTDTRWVDPGASLAAPLPKDTSALKAIIMTGDDGSKSLYTFDMTVSPNSVSRSVLFTGPGAPVQNAPTVRRAPIEDSRVSTRNRRDPAPLTVNGWPAYNSTLAPTATRSTFGLARDPDGLVVAAGGNDEDVLCIFDARQNSWQNATDRLVEAKLFASDSFSSALSTATATSTALTSSATAAVAASATPSSTNGPLPVGGGLPNTNSILAAVLGSIFGLAVVLFGLYWCIQRKRKQHAHIEAGHTRRASGISSDEKSGIGYASDSLPHAPSGVGVFRGHQTQNSASSFSSMAILMGRLNQAKPGQSSPARNPSNNTKHGSVESTFKAFKSTISKPIPQNAPRAMTAQPPQPDVQSRDEKGVSFAPDTVEPRPRNTMATTPDEQGSMRRSSGWNRYWSGGSALNLLGLGAGSGNANAAANVASQRTTIASESSSHYSNGHRITQDSATVPPLQIYESRASFSHVASRSPTIAQNHEKIREGLSGQIETHRPVSGISSVSGYSSGIPASVHDAWDPTESRPWGADRAQATFYNASTSAYSTPLAPASASSRAPSQSTTPRQQPQQQQQEPQQPITRDDMSWLNLGDGR
ncbi:hypothetical protein B0H67DRAFT_596633 [Lasiosphaeris hirsuta]|uniref:Pre-mRNA splicing factor CLF1 n=1 Tax=Lasiosphaeris hirsuta TaxID=260670 RepID=A0AA40BA74_9PEZI|nr:hypothetical protein B0H67DRAFT_596633 [Lasiosphaeris hirsuta]